MSPRRARRALVLGAVVCATTALAGCGNGDDQGGSDVTKVTGSCALDGKQYDTLSPLSADQLEAMLGQGDYRVDGTVRPGGNGVPEGGACTYSRGDSAVLELGVNRQTDLFRTYDEARELEKTGQAHAIDGADGYVVSDPGSGDTKRGPLAVVFGQDHQVVTLHVLIPGRDAPSDEAVGRAAAAAAKSLAAPMTPA